MNTPDIETSRLVLKRGSYEDYVKVYEYDMTKLRHIDGEFIFEKYNPKKLKGINTIQDDDVMMMDFILYLKDTNEPIGNLVYDRYQKDTNSLEISCNMHPHYWNKGYMSEAIIESMRYLFNNYDFNNIRYGYAEENIASKALSDKIGFMYYGSSYEYYSRLKKDIKEITTIISKEEFINKYGLDDKSNHLKRS